VVAAFVYHDRPMLYTVIRGLPRTLKVTPFAAGQDCDAMLISFELRMRP
jgi:hypothetical protein